MNNMFHTEIDAKEAMLVAEHVTDWNVADTWAMDELDPDIAYVEPIAKAEVKDPGFITTFVGRVFGTTKEKAPTYYHTYKGVRIGHLSPLPPGQLLPPGCALDPRKENAELQLQKLELEGEEEPRRVNVLLLDPTQHPWRRPPPDCPEEFARLTDTIQSWKKTNGRQGGARFRNTPAKTTTPGGKRSLD
eukprot:TRINITY_DN66677_c2_g7_i2.p1 TRINITY_DN66677_c2_g7~~TRINITY_DN66677_c2_g7_i2.p1  ORF type:complete len:189 (-),score=14.82 TRINITY_DN66677_c2_g7_i2:445-1011(-)